GLADGLFADAADVIDGAGHVIEDNGGGAPEADEGEGDAADEHQVDLALLPVGRQVDDVELGGLGGFNGGHGGWTPAAAVAGLIRGWMGGVVERRLDNVGVAPEVDQ